MPSVSVILPFYNRKATLPRCVESVLRQTHEDWEIIAVDDASTDESRRVLDSYQDARIRVLRHPSNRGAGPARDTAMSAATGKWFAFLDSDDEWLPEKLAAQMAALQTTGHRLSTCFFEFHRNGKVRVLPKPMTGSFEESLHWECTYGFGSTLLIDRDLAARLGPFDPDLPRHEDWDWILRAAKQGEQLALVQQPLARVYGVDRPAVEKFAPSTERFLLLHAASFEKYGHSHARRVAAQHYESVASMAYEQRQYALGHRYLLKSYARRPWRNPLPLAALPLGLIDGVCGTALIQWGAAVQRSLFHRSKDALP